MAIQQEGVNFTTNFGDLTRQIEKVVAKLNAMGISLEKVVDVTGRFTKTGKPLLTTLTGIDDLGGKITASFKSTGTVISNVAASFSGVGTAASIAQKKIEELQTRIALQDQAVDNKLRISLGKAFLAISESTLRSAERRRDVGNQLISQASTLNTTKKQLLGTQERLSSSEKELNAALLKGEASLQRRQALVARISKLRQSGATRIAQRVGVIDAQASVTEINKVATAQITLEETILRSGLKIREAQKIVAQAIREPEKAFRGAAKAIANDARALNTALAGSGEGIRQLQLSIAKLDQARDIKLRVGFDKANLAISESFVRSEEKLKSIGTELISQASTLKGVKTQLLRLSEKRQQQQKTLNALLEENLRLVKKREVAERASAKVRADAARRVVGTLGVADAQSSVIELNKVAAAQSRLEQTIVQSGLKIRDAQKIVTQAIREPGKAFSGVAATIAADARKLNTALINSGGEFRKFSAAATATAVAAKQAAGGLRVFGVAAEQAGKKGTGAAQNLLVSWKSFGRLLITQQIHLVISRITFAIRDAIRDTIDFQKRISELRTIAQDNQLTFGTWAKEIRSLAGQFNRTGADVAEAAYQTLSNQVAKGTEVFGFLSTALKLSRVAVGSSEDAVNLLTSAINSFQLKTTDADRVAAILFKTIELGRVRLSEMASTFGRVGAIASQAGLSLEETAGAIEVLTISGLKFNRASTFFINLIKGLIKPSKAVTALFKEQGFASAAAALSTLKFTGTIELLNKAISGSSEELFRLLPNLRGAQGLAGLTGKSFGQLTTSIEQTSKGAEAFNKGLDIVQENSGDKVTKALNKVSLAFQKFGDSILKTVVKFGDTFGGLDKVLLNAAKGFGVLIAAIAPILIAGAFAGIAKGLAAVGVALLGPVGILAALTATIAAFVLFKETAEESFDRILVANKKASERILKRDIFELQEKFSNALKIEDLKRQIANRITAQEVRSLRERLDVEENSLQLSLDTIRAHGDAVLDILKASISEIKKEITGLRRLIEASEKFALDVSRKAEQLKLNLQISRGDPVEQITAIDARLKTLQGTIQKLQAGQGDLVNIKDARTNLNELKKVFDEIAKLIAQKSRIEKTASEKSVRTAEQAATKVARANERILKIDRQLVKARQATNIRNVSPISSKNRGQSITRELQRQSDAEAKVNELIRERQKQQEIIASNEGVTATIINSQAESFRLIDSLVKSIAKGEAERQKLAKKLSDDKKKELEQLESQRKLVKEITKRTLKFDPTDDDAVAQLARLTQLKKDFDALGNLQIDVEFDLQKELAQKIAQLTNQLDTETQIKKLQLDSAARDKDFKAKVANAKELESIAIASSNKIDKLRNESLAAAQNLAKNFEASQAILIGNLSAISQKKARGLGITTNKFGFEVVDTSIAAQKLVDIIRDAENVSFDTTKTGLSDIINIFAELTKVGSFNILERIVGKDTDQRKIVLQLQDISKNMVALVNENTKKNEALAEGLGASEDELTTVKSIGLAFANQVLQLEAKLKAIKLINIELAKEPVQPPREPVLPPVPGRRAMGGKGIDTVPSILSKGEFVTNRNASKRFRNQLIRMNSGLPTFADGGVVGGTTVGNINVSVNGGDTSEATIQEIGVGLRREIRRGRLRFD